MDQQKSFLYCTGFGTLSRFSESISYVQETFFFFFWQKVRKDLCFEVSTEHSTTYKFLKAALKIVCSIHYGAVLLIDSLRDPTTWLWRWKHILIMSPCFAGLTLTITMNLSHFSQFYFYRLRRCTGMTIHGDHMDDVSSLFSSYQSLSHVRLFAIPSSVVPFSSCPQSLPA